MIKKPKIKKKFYLLPILLIVSFIVISSSALPAQAAEGDVLWEFDPIAETATATGGRAQGVAVGSGDYDGVYVVGNDNFGGDTNDWRVDKYSKDGNRTPVWSHQINIFSGYDEVPMDVAVVSSGPNAGVYVAGGCEIGNLNDRWCIEKLNQAGTQVWMQTTPVTRGIARSIVAGNDGLYIAGNTFDNNREFVWRVEKRDFDGNLKTSFGNAGVILVSNLNSVAYDIVLSGSDLYIVGDQLVEDAEEETYQWRIEKRNSNTGALVSGFGSGGVVNSDPSGFYDGANGVALDATGLYVVGSENATDKWRIEKRNSNTGALVIGFGSGGVISDDPTGGDSIPNDVAVYNGGVYVVGRENAKWRVEKRNSTTGALLIGPIVMSTIRDALSVSIDSTGIYASGKKGFAWRLEKREVAPLPLPTAPDPTSVAGSCPSNSSPQHTISWTDQSTNEVKFKVYRDTSSFTDVTGKFWVGTVDSTTVSGTGTSYSISDTSPTKGQTMYYRVVAENLDGRATVDTESPQLSIPTDSCGPTITSVSITDPAYNNSTLTGAISGAANRVSGTPTLQYRFSEGGTELQSWSTTSTYNCTPLICSKGDTITVEGRAYDGISYSSIVSDPVVISNQAPTATPQSVSTNEDTSVNITLAGTDADGDTLTYSYNQPAAGTGAVSGTAPNATYTPPANYNGSTSFTFTVSDGSLTSTAATVSITVNPVNDGPTMSAGSDKPANTNGTVSFSDASASDIDGDTLTYSWSCAGGTISGTFVNFALLNPIYNAPNTEGTDDCTLTVSDGTLSPSDALQVTVTDAPVMSGTLTATNCTITAGNSSCLTTLTWTTTNPVGVSAITTPTDIEVVRGNSGSVTYPVEYSSRSFYLYNNAVLLTQATATASCASGTTWDGTKCKTNNVSPTANAGNDLSIVFPTSSVTISGASSSDSDGTIVSNVWSFVSGPVTPTIDNGATLTPTFNGMTAVGNYVFRLTATDDSGATDTDDMQVTVTDAPVMSGTLTATNCTITAGNSSCLTTLTWTTTNPVGVSAITTPTDIEVVRGNSGSVTYPVEYSSRSFYLYNNAVLLTQATATASCASGTTWDGTKCKTNNVSPTANAGNDLSIVFPTSSVGASGASVVDNDGTIVSNVWSFVSGPVTPTIDNGATLTPTFNGMTAVGNYVFRLTATDDSGATDTDDMQVTVTDAPVMSGTLTATNCTITAGNSSCLTTLTWTTTNPVGVSAITTPTDIEVVRGNSGSVTYPVEYSSRSFYLYNNAVLLTQATATASCASGTTWDGSVCETNPTYDLTVTKPGSGTGTVTSNPGGINCGVGCSIPFDSGTSVYLTAVPAGGSNFAGWSGDCSASLIPQITSAIIMNGAKTCAATFNLDVHTLTVTRSGSGTGTVTGDPSGNGSDDIDCGTNCDAPFNHNTPVTLTATPGTAPNKFIGWSGGGCSGTGTCVVTMGADKTVDAKFYLPTFTINDDSPDDGDKTATILKGDYEQYDGCYDEDGGGADKLPICSPSLSLTRNAIEWLSNLPGSLEDGSSIATIDGEGLATGVAEGSVTISGTYDGITDTASLQVVILPELTAGAPTPTNSIPGAITLYSDITNGGSAATGDPLSTFSNFFQVCSGTMTGEGNCSETPTDLAFTPMNVLAAGATAATSQSNNFIAGTYYIRACADKTDHNGGGVVTESNEENNCSVWTRLTVADAPTNDAPIAVAGIYSDPVIGNINNVDVGSKISVTKGDLTRFYLFAWTGTRSDTDLNKKSRDPDGWTDSNFGMSGGNAKCEWDTDLVQGEEDFAPDLTRTIPTSFVECSDPDNNSSNYITINKTFNDDPGTYTYYVLKMTDRANPEGVSNPLGTVSVEVLAQCGDGKDNDSDTKIDSLDPGCHTDGNVSNPESYNPIDNDETDPPSIPKPDLRASVPRPTNPIPGVISFSSTITNEGNADAGDFTNIFQVSSYSDGDLADNDPDDPINYTTDAVDSLPFSIGENSVTISKDITLTADTYYMRVCADSEDFPGGPGQEGNGVIDESNEGNNCSSGVPWTKITVTENHIPVAVAGISDVAIGKNTDVGSEISVRPGVPTTFYLSAWIGKRSDADPDKKSRDPDGWAHSDFGMSDGGAKCEWDLAFGIADGFVTSSTRNDPTSFDECSDPEGDNYNYITVTNKIFDEAPGTYTYYVLKMTDKAGGVSDPLVGGTVSVKVLAQCENGIDDDEDTKIDFGTGPSNDPGCFSLTDNDEADTSQPDLTAGVPTYTPTPVVTGISTTLSSVITNGGNASTGVAFYNFFQVCVDINEDAVCDDGTIADIDYDRIKMPALDADGGNATASKDYTFTSAGAYLIRACADKTDHNGGGLVNEGPNEDNNCAAWTAIAVNAPTNHIPVAVAGISDVAIGKNTDVGSEISVRPGVPTTFYLSAWIGKRSDADPDKKSRDPDGWAHSDFGMSDGGAKCEWDLAFGIADGFVTSSTRNDPTSFDECSDPEGDNYNYITVTNKIFDEAPGTYTYYVLKMTDKAGGVSDPLVGGTVSVKVLAQCENGIDDDEDGMTDYPDDLGCNDTEGRSDNNEVNGQCSDTRDNDGDTKTDFPDDKGCSDARNDNDETDTPSVPLCAETHYNCINSSSSDNRNNITNWTWTCTAADGISAQCVELKRKPKFKEN